MSWTSMRLDGVALEVRETIDPQIFGDVEVEHYSIPALDSTGFPEVVPSNEIMSDKQRLKGGEVLVSRLNPRKARVLTVPALGDRVAMASGEFIVLRPFGIEPRFLTYLLLAESTRQFLDARVQSVTRSHQRVRPEHLTKMSIRVPDDWQQQAIADFLDAETARIDALIAKKRRLIAVLDQRLEGAIEQLSSAFTDACPLKRVARVTYGLGQPPPEADDGVAIIRATNISRGTITTHNLMRTKLDDLPLDRAPLLREGEILVVRSGALTGDSARITAAWAGSAPGYDLRVAPVSIDSRFLAWQLLGRYAIDQIHIARTRAAQPHLNAEELSEVVVRRGARDEEARVADALDELSTRLGAVKVRLQEQADLLVEHRQALITAAVTGELSVPGVAA